MTFLDNSDGGPSSHPLLSYTDSVARMWQDFILLVGRVLIGWLFFDAGMRKIWTVAEYSKTFPRRGLQEWMAFVSVPAELFGGLFLMLGFATRYTVLVMLFFMVVASFSSHAYWAVDAKAYRGQYSHFWKNASITGGLVVLFVTAAGKISLDGLLRRKG